jgi:predicted acyltransferase
MILVNTPGSWSFVYVPLMHAKWHGCTLTDLVFPFFLFVMGAAMSFSVRKFDYPNSQSSGPFIGEACLNESREHGFTKCKISKSATSHSERVGNILNFKWNYKPTPEITIKILKRVLLIFLIGLALNYFPFQIELTNIRIMGVLQRIAITYGIASFLCLWLNKTKLFFISGLILICYWVLLAVFGSGSPYSLEGNLVRMIDLAVIGESNMSRKGIIAFDPEGLLSTLPAVVTVLLGYLTGYFLQNQHNMKRAVYQITIAGVAAVIIGMVWGLIFPINKYLWTSSFVLYTSGLAIVALTFCLYLIDVKGYRKWSVIFQVFGWNSLFVYVLSIIWVKILLYLIKIIKPDGSVINGYNWIFNNWFLPAAGYHKGSLLFAFTHVLLFWLIALVLYKKKIQLKI